MLDILLVTQIVVAVLLIIVILLQKTGSDGLSGLGGGGGAGGGLVTARAAANFLTRATVLLAAIFMVNAIALANLSGKKQNHSNISKQLEENTVPLAK
ncbi:MAG: preprotein translocase subunit SecG [Pseudomonadota bacterium]